MFVYELVVVGLNRVAVTYIDFSVENNDNDPKFKVGNHVTILKYKNIFAKDYTPNWSEDVFVIKKVINNVPWTCVIENLNEKELFGMYSEKELQKTNQAEPRVEKIKKIVDKIYVKWKGYDKSFNSSIDKKYTVMYDELFSWAI